MIALFVYLLASCLFMGVIMDNLEDGETMKPINLLIASLLWPVDAFLMIWGLLNDSQSDNDPDN